MEHQDIISIEVPNKKNLLVRLKRGSKDESKHRAHVAISDLKGRILFSAGDSNIQTFIRSSLKPFQVLPFLSSGAADSINCNPKGIAICCGSHCGSAMHAREAFKILWNSKIDVDMLKCPTPNNFNSPLQHNCSGKHSCFLATCKKLNWSLEDYLEVNHPIQQEIIRRIVDILKIPKEELIIEKDDCGAPTLLLQLSHMAFLYAYLGGSQQADIEKICRAMISHPEMVGGKGRFDTELISRAHGQLISKGGSEGIQCLSNLKESIGIAIKIEDGSKRAKHAVALKLLRDLDWITPTALTELEDEFLRFSPNVSLEVDGSFRFDSVD